MSSFGPSVVGIVESDSQADNLLIELQKSQKNGGGHVYICKPNNIGAKIEYFD